MLMSVHPVGVAYQHRISPFIVLVCGRKAGTNDPVLPIGTGIICGRAGPSAAVSKPLVITAGHVLEDCLDEPFEWTIIRGGRKARIATFVTPSDLTGAPWALAWKAKHLWDGQGELLDIGALAIPRLATDGEPFLEDGERVPKVLHREVGLLPGVKVAWAGFPGVMMDVLKRPLLCYYEGVISAILDSAEDPPLYVIDGHNCPGVSGAPFWYWDEEEQDAFVSGVICSYAHGHGASNPHMLPGLVLATPLRPILAFFDARAKERALATRSDEAREPTC